MRFKQWQQVLDGTKTQTRRLVKRGELSWHDGVCASQDTYGQVDRVYGTDCRIKWAVGRTYAIQPGRGKKAVGRTPPIRAIRREGLGNISEGDCLAEGIEYSRLYPDGMVYEQYGCPVCELFFREAKSAYACLWNHCGGNWEKDRDSMVWVLDWEET